MIKAEDLLIEIGTEELPPKDLIKLSESFVASLRNQLDTSGISYSDYKSFATPRRLAVIFYNLALQQPMQSVEKRGPAIAAAYDKEGHPTPAALGFAKSCGVAIKDLTTLQTEHGSWLFYSQQVAGKNTAELLPQFVQNALNQLPIKKNMRWGNGDYAFVRPVHWIILLHGKAEIPANIFGIQSSNVTYGHRVLCGEPIIIKQIEDYEQLLEEKGYVIADFKRRRDLIAAGVQDLARQVGAKAIVEDDLLDLVCGLVEYPVPLMAGFAQEFLQVPQECLISAMQDHQKCFAVADEHGKLLPKFILVSNMLCADPQLIIRGNELVMHARLADATFYYTKDRKQTLASRVPELKNIVYQKQLGTLFEKVERIQKLAVFIAENLSAANLDAKDKQVLQDLSLVKQAAHLCKADLLTNMVYEFPELQGTMGQYYALHDQEDERVAYALSDYYRPRNAQDDLPDSTIGICLALADRIDSLVGLFGIGLVPSGEKDPYALRRQALAVMRIMIEKNVDFDLAKIIAYSSSLYGSKISDPSKSLLEFCFERLKGWRIDNLITAKIFAAVYANGATNPTDFNRRLFAVAKFQELPAALSLAAANKRVKNLLEKASLSESLQINDDLLQDPSEIKLYAELQQKSAQIAPMVASADYAAVLLTLSTLQESVDNFFNNVLVMADDHALRENRLCLLQQLRALFLKVADVSVL